MAKICNLAVTSIYKGRLLACQKIMAGFSKAFQISIRGSVPPCDDLMVSLPLWWKSTGKAEPYFFWPKLNFLKMTSTEKQLGKSPFEIINELIAQDEIRNFKSTLTEFFYEWVQSDLNYSAEERSTMLSHYRGLLTMLEEVDELQKKDSMKIKLTITKSNS